MVSSVQKDCIFLQTNKKFSLLFAEWSNKLLSIICLYALLVFILLKLKLFWHSLLFWLKHRLINYNFQNFII